MRLSLKAFVWITGAVAVAAGGFVFFNSSGNGSATTVVTPPPMSVPVVLAQQRTVPVYLDFVGATEAIRSVTLEAKVTGYLDGRPVGDGADVQKDQLLYQIDPHDYQAALDQVTAAGKPRRSSF